MVASLGQGNYVMYFGRRGQPPRRLADLTQWVRLDIERTDAPPFMAVPSFGLRGSHVLIVMRVALALMLGAKPTRR